MSRSNLNTNDWQKKKGRLRILILLVLALFGAWHTILSVYSGIIDRATDKNTLSFWGTLMEKPNPVSGRDRNSTMYDFKLMEYPNVVFEVVLPYPNKFYDDIETGDSISLTIPLKYLPKLKSKNKNRIFDDYLFSRNRNVVWVYAIRSRDVTYWTINNYNHNILWTRVFPGYVILLLFFMLGYFLHFTKNNLRDDLAD